MEENTLTEFKTRVQTELMEGLVPFWKTQVIDYQNGGFIGRMENDRTIDRRAVKGLILNARLLWSYAALFRYTSDDAFLTLAQRAYNYLVDFFLDKDYGGAYWFVDFQGNFVEPKKKMYGQAFTVYALAEYYKITEEKSILELATNLFDLIESYAFDKTHDGYLESFERNWSLAEDLRLSDLDMNEKKSMNTHLHVLEAYTNLYRIWKNKTVENKLAGVLRVFHDHIIDFDTSHFKLFFDEAWTSKSEGVSFGHDIEGSWLLAEAAQVLGQEQWIEDLKPVSVAMARAVLDEAMDRDGGIMYEADVEGISDSDKHWWPQAEGVVGFINAYQISGDESFLKAALKTWTFIERHIINKRYGEWFWRVSKDRKPYREEAKVSEWKSPYHNCRACLEIMARIDAILVDMTNIEEL